MASLWLVPPEDSSLFKATHSLILTGIPSIYPVAIPPQFTPHVTLVDGAITADMELTNPQKWLDDLKVGDLSQLQMTIDELYVGDIFFRKLVQLCDKTPELASLAAHCRGVATGNMEEAKAWLEENYVPHCSLLYSDLPSDEVRSKLHEANAKIQETKKSYSDCTYAKGGSIWLVPTFKDLDEWKPIARKVVPDVQWVWAT